MPGRKTNTSARRRAAPKASGNKTVPTAASVAHFLETRDSEARRADARVILDLMKKATRDKPVMWGPSIIGFGERTFAYESGRYGQMPVIAFSPRRAALVLYLEPEFPERRELLARLGKHRASVSCIYVNRLADVDVKVIDALIRASVKHTKAVKRSQG